MTSTPHTPGPWTVEPLQGTDGADIAICAPCNGWVVAVIQYDPDIQTVDDPDGDTVIHHPADFANARLIAAAPEMLEALEMIHADDDGDGYISAEGMQKIREVIAKARGTWR